MQPASSKIKMPVRLPSKEAQEDLCRRYPVEPVQIAAETLMDVSRKLPKFGPHPLLQRIVLRLISEGHFDADHDVYVCPWEKLVSYSGMQERAFREHLTSAENLMLHLSYLSDSRMIGAAADFGISRRLQSDVLFDLGILVRSDRSIAVLFESTMVDALTKKVLKSKKKQKREVTMQNRRQNARIAVCDDAEFIADYLNARPGRRFTDICKRNIRSAVAVMKALPGSTGSRLAVAIMLDEIAREPWTAYGASGEGKSVRLFASSSSYMYLKREVRRELLKGWTEYDMAACQVAIVAKDWAVESLQELLSSEADPYLAIADGCLDHRSVVKEAVIQTIFGMPVPGIKSFLTKKLDKATSDIVINNPFMLDLLSARDKAILAAVTDGFIDDCYGRRYTVLNDEDARSALACCAQAREMNLIRPAYDVAAQSKGLMSINVHLHDGFVAGFKRDDERRVWGNRAIDAVNSRCLELGYATRLRCKD